ncbi:MAG: carbohydrate ABC transporter permease [Spirochaetales bacterium]|nr:carbohydrate ABC transporter permease [Spirochaetales bacterium]
MKLAGRKTNTIIILSIFTALFIYPIVAVVSISISHVEDIYTFGYRIIPKSISWDAYKYIFASPQQLFSSYRVSIIVTVLGTLLGLLIMSMLAFSLSRKNFKFKRPLTYFVFFTIIFNPGLVPWYINIAQTLGMKNTYLALIVPYLVWGWFTMLLRTFFASIPEELFESCEMDGANQFTVFFRITLPLSKPALASVGLLMMLRYWNDWFLGLLYINNTELMPLQLWLYNIMVNIEEMSRVAADAGVIETINFPSESARMAMAVLAAGPILLVLPFFQKYFVKGITVGSIKG